MTNPLNELAKNFTFLHKVCDAMQDDQNLQDACDYTQSVMKVVYETPEGRRALKAGFRLLDAAITAVENTVASLAAAMPKLQALAENFNNLSNLMPDPDIDPELQEHVNNMLS